MSIGSLKTKLGGGFLKIQILFKQYPALLYITIGLVYLLVTFYYMTPQFTQCKTITYGFGDSTAGPIWRNSLPDKQPILGGYQRNTNYPYGESLFTPVSYSLALQAAVVWVTAKIAGPVCGFNVLNAIGFVFTALAMFSFVYWLTRRKGLAILSGYIVSFQPYFQYKVGGHPSYGYAGFLILVLWFFLKLYKERKPRDAIILGLSIAACLYWDPYFTLLAATMVLPLGLIWFLHWCLQKRRKSFIEEFKLLLSAAGVTLILLLPLVGVKLAYSSKINSYVSGSRGSKTDIMIDAKYCSILPWDYFTPSDSNYFFSKLAQSYKQRVMAVRHACNPSEYTTGLNWIVSITVVIGLVIIAWEVAQKRRLYDEGKERNRLLVTALVACLGVLLIAMAIAFPPSIGKLRFPSYLLLQITTTWRILAREFLVINIATTTLFMLVLVFLAGKFKKISKRIKWLVLVFIFIASFVQQQTFTPFQGSGVGFNYNKDMPTVFNWLRDQKQINALAAYPLDKVGESETLTYQLTGQKVHGKPLLNSALPNARRQPLFFSIKDLSDPQTLPALRSMGIEYVIIRGLSTPEIESVPGLKVLYYEDFYDPAMGGLYAVAKITTGSRAKSAITLQTGFPVNHDIMKSAIDIQYEVVNGARLSVESLGGDSTAKTADACFEVGTGVPGRTNTIRLVADGNQVSGPLRITAEYRPVKLTVPIGHWVTLESQSGDNFRLNNLGCRQ